jgi:hypothetical protein
MVNGKTGGFRIGEILPVGRSPMGRGPSPHSGDSGRGTPEVVEGTPRAAGRPVIRFANATSPRLRDGEDLTPQREMGPALRLTPLSPACGPCRSRKLDAWRFNAVFVLLRRANRNRPIIARRSRRRRFRRGRVRSEDLSLPPGGSETGLSTRASNGLALPVGSTRPQRRAGKSGLCDLAPSRLHRFGIRIAPGEPGALLVSFLHRAAFRRRLEAVPKSLLRRRPFGLCLGRANPRLDVWKMRGAADSGKRGTVQLSTFGQNASGQGWITQRLAAEAAAYPRSRRESRCASSRSRSALSLMNPAASCWS